MVRAVLLGLTVLGGLVAGPTAQAHHFAIDLQLQAGKVRKTAHAQVLGLGVRPKDRSNFTVKAGKRIKVHWTLRSTAAGTVSKNVLAHFFVVREKKAGQRTVPKLDKDVLLESALTMDFKPGDKAEGDLNFTVEKPGAYLVRLETIGAATNADPHEHFAALDLVAQ